MIALSRLSSGRRRGQRVLALVSAPGARRTILRVMAFLILASLNGCAWWREYRDTFAYSQSLYKKALDIELKGKPLEATNLLRQSIEANPDDPEVRWELARILLDQGQTTEALQELRYLVKHYPEDSRAYMSLARTLLQRGRFDDAAQLTDLALDLDPSCAEGLLLRAQIAEARKDVELALDTYHYLLLQQPEDVAVRLRLARLETDEGDNKGAAALLRETIANIPLTPEQASTAQWLLGLNYAQLERWPDAAAALALGLPAENVAAMQRYELAYACFRAGDVKRARVELAHVLHAEPENRTAQAMLGELDSSAETFSKSNFRVIPTGHSRN